MVKWQERKKIEESNEKLSAEFNKSIENFVDEEIWMLARIKRIKRKQNLLPITSKQRLAQKKCKETDETVNCFKKDFLKSFHHKQVDESH